MKRNHPEDDNASDISAARLERAEAEFMYQYESMAPRSAATSLGIVTARIGGGVVLSMRNDVTGYWSKALGFGSGRQVAPYDNLRFGSWSVARWI